MDRKLKICFTSDVHGYLYPTNYGDEEVRPMGLFQCAGGFEKDEDTLVIDGGDMLQGSAFAYYCSRIGNSPKPLADAVNECGYDYYTIGNHDFNYGREYQLEYIRENHAHCLSQNICDEAGKPLYPAVIHTMKNGLKVGLVGIVTDYINIWEKKENLTGVQVTDPFEAAKAALQELKGKTDLNICIYHGGFEDDLKTGKRLSKTTENVGCKICRELDFDVLLTGHQHMSTDGQDLYGTWVVQPADRGKEYHWLEILVSEDGALKIHSEKKSADPSLGAPLREQFAENEKKVQTWLNLPVGHLSHALVPGDKLEMALHGSEIADFINEIQLNVSGAEVSVVGLANEIAGFRTEVTTRDIIATYPFPNTLVVCRITGAQLKAAIERSAQYFAVKADGTLTIADSFLHPKVEHYNYDYFMGISYRLDPFAPIGERVVSMSRNGKEIQQGETLSLCLNNYRFSGAGEYPMYPECPVIREINTEMVEIIMDYFRTHPQIEIGAQAHEKLQG